MSPRTRTLRSGEDGAAPSTARLLVIEGPDRGRQSVVEGTAIIGSRADASLVLTDDAVSRQHVALELAVGRVRVVDLGSKNGTRYLGARVSRVDVPLGAVLELGVSRVVVLPPEVPPETVSARESLGGLRARSVAMRRLFAQAEQVAGSEATVLLTGETGTGKEALARTLHALSPRAQAPFVTFDCGATTSNLVQSVLFGHVRGAFTGAVKDTVGLVEAAHQGVLFLDEVAALPADLQPVLLRVLESRTFHRVGDGRPRESDFQLFASTAEDLPTLVKQGRFRSDLYYRLSAIVLEVPPLRSRLDDVPLLAQAFATELKARAPLSPMAVSSLAAWRWPGNVRELRNAVERLVTLGDAALAEAEGTPTPPSDFHAAREQAVAAFERSYLEALLEKHHGSASAAAREGNIARSYLYKLLEQHQLDPEKFRRR